MTQILDSLPSQCAQRILCSYFNATSNIQVVRISNVPGWYFERVVFSGTILLFESIPQAYLEVHTGTTISAMLADRIPCSELQVAEGGS
jgi:hypothetical protein